MSIKNKVIKQMELEIKDLTELKNDWKKLAIESAEKVEELERKLKDLSELIETESYTDHNKCQDVVCITPLIELIEFEE